MQRFSTWFSRQKPFGKLAIGCGGLFLLLCLCSIPISIFSPSTPGAETLDVSSVQTAAFETAVVRAWISATQTAQFQSTATVVPSATTNVSNQIEESLKAQFLDYSDVVSIKAIGNDIIIESELSKKLPDSVSEGGLELLDSIHLAVYDIVYTVYSSNKDVETLQVDIKLNGELIYSVRTDRERAFAFPLENMNYEPTVTNYIFAAVEQKIINQWEIVFVRDDLAGSINGPSQSDIANLLDWVIAGDYVFSEFSNNSLHVTLTYDGLYQLYSGMPNPDPNLIQEAMTKDYTVDAVGIIYQMYSSIPNLQSLRITMIFQGSVIKDINSTSEQIKNLGGVKAFYDAIYIVSKGNSLLEQLQ